MLDFDLFTEIFATIRKNKMRTLLTSFAVSWGIFMLIVLLAAGNGLQNGVMSNFSDRAKNTVTVYPGSTSMPYGGFSTDRKILLDAHDYDVLKQSIPGIEYISPSIERDVVLNYGEEYGSWGLQGVSPDASNIINIRIHEGNGRFINPVDMDKRRKVIVLHPEMERVLFRGENPIGKYVIAGNIPYQVIGVYDASNQFNSNPSAYIPFSTAQDIYFKGHGFSKLEFTVNGIHNLTENDQFKGRLKQKIAQIHEFDPRDGSAVHIRNNVEVFVQTEKIFTMLKFFIIIVGIASMMAGIVGVGNIMLITVKERTVEIGIRKALGAKPASVLRLIIFESIMITTGAGYLGILAGVGLTEVANWMVKQIPSEKGTIFLNPTVGLGTIFAATALLVLCGVIAGLIPALKATRVRPIEAMRTNN